MGCFTFCRKKDAIIVAGAGGVGAPANGRYKVISLHGGLPKFKKVGGCSIIFFSTFWKINVEDDTTGWYYEAPDGIWKASFPAAEPPPSLANMDTKLNESHVVQSLSISSARQEELQQESEPLQKLLEEQHNICNGLQTEVAQLRMQLQTAEEHRETLRIEQQSAKGMRQHAAQLQAERQSVQTMRQEIAQLHKEKEGFLYTLEEQHKICNGLQTEVAQLRMQLQTAEGYRETLRIEQQSAEGLRQQIAQLQTERQSVQTVRQEIAQIHKEKEGFSNDLAAQIAQLKSENLILKDGLFKACEELAFWERNSGQLLVNASDTRMSRQKVVQAKR